MLSIRTQPKQTFRDLAVQLYGTGDATAVLELISLNTQLFDNGAEIEITDVLPLDTLIYYEESSVLIDRKGLARLAELGITVITTGDNSELIGVFADQFGDEFQ